MEGINGGHSIFKRRDIRLHMLFYRLRMEEIDEAFTKVLGGYFDVSVPYGYRLLSLPGNRNGCLQYLGGACQIGRAPPG